MVVFRHYILNAIAVLILLCACSSASYGQAVNGSLGQAMCASGSVPDPSVIVLMVSALVSTALCGRLKRRIATGF